MQPGLTRFPVFSLALRGRLASCWKANRPLFRQTTLNATRTRLSYSSIADAMLGRAHKEYVPPAPKDDLAKQLFSSSSPAHNGNIEHQFKKSLSSKSIGGFTNYKNPQNVLHATSPNLTQISRVSSFTPATSIAPRSTSLSTVLSKQDSFQDTPDLIDLSQELPATSRTHCLPVEYDENDFDDDVELDLDMDYELPTPMAAPPKQTSKSNAPNPLPHPLPKMSNTAQTHPSSVATWSSSSPSHLVSPPGALERRKREAAASQDSSQPPRLAKRRTLPWAQKQAEDEQLAVLKEEEEAAVASSSAYEQKKCFRCKKDGHDTKECPTFSKGKGTLHDFTPAPKDKHMPWNNTGSAIKEEKKKFKDRQKAARKADEDAFENHHRFKKTALAPITLSTEQKRVQELVVNDSKSVFFTGSAGTGKSVLMRSIIGELKKKYLREPDRVAVTASTGLAACNIGGVTLHSFGGIGLGKEDVPTLVKKIKRNAKAKNRWIRTKVLIIDEISMVDGDLFDKLEGIARAMRNNGRPFGGIQLVITGDFFQLPPVPEYDNKSRGVKFAFDAGTWPTAIHHTIGLTEVFRQKDPVFANMLNEMRLGKITDETVAAFKKLSRRISPQAALVEATELFPTRNEVENSNAARMRGLVGESFKYEARDTGTITDLAMRDKLLSNMMAPKNIELKKGAQVMLIKNIDDSLVNGSLGKVAGFMNEKTFEYYMEHPEAFDGSTDLDEDERAEHSRVIASLSSKSLTGTSDSGRVLPVVEFALADGTTRRMLMQPEEWKVELPNGEVQAQRSQIPLILAWALSIHKAQGQTLECVKIDLKKIFEKGQAYVALSRATTQAGLEVHNFDKTKVMAHPRVAEFYNSLYSVNKALEHPKVAVAATPDESKKSEIKQFQGYEKERKTGKMAAYG